MGIDACPPVSQTHGPSAGTAARRPSAPIYAMARTQAMIQAFARISPVSQSIRKRGSSRMPPAASRPSGRTATALGNPVPIGSGIHFRSLRSTGENTRSPFHPKPTTQSDPV